jgi:predicted nuclease of predicted toxin-antitoxin system
VAAKIKIYLDEHVSQAIAEGLRRRGVDVLTTQESGMCSAPDEELLAFALSRGRVVFTQDSDFMKLHAGGLPHAGLVYAHRQTAVGQIIRGLMLIVEILDSDDMAGHIEFI